MRWVTGIALVLLCIMPALLLAHATSHEARFLFVGLLSGWASAGVIATYVAHRNKQRKGEAGWQEG